MRAAPDAQAIDLRRKAVHVGCGLMALSFRWLTWQQALALALAAFAFNLLLLPRLGGRRLLREDEHGRGWALGILLYPLAVASLVVAFGPSRGLLVPAMGWALLAFGDGAASLVGMRWGSRPLPWNVTKSWEGLVAHALAGGVAAAAIGGFVAAGGLVPSEIRPGDIVLAAGLAALVTSLLESVDSGIDDNLKVAWAGALMADLVLVASVTGLDVSSSRAIVAAGICVILGVAAWHRGRLTIAGSVAAALMGTAMVAWGDWGSFAALCTFFALGVGATRLGRRVKEARGIAEGRGGRRGFGNVVANGGIALICAFYAARGGFADPFSGTAGRITLVALVAALATAAFDTVSSEIGKAWGRRTLLVTTLRPVPPGTEGAVSLEGTLAGAAAAVVVGLVGIPALLGWSSAWLVLLVVLPAAFVGTTFESVVGATVERRGHRLHNDLLNFANTLVGALAAAGLMWMFRA